MRKGQWGRTYIYLHLPSQTIIHDKAMGQSNTMWFHRVAKFVAKVANVHVIKVVDAFLCIPCPEGRV